MIPITNDTVIFGLLAFVVGGVFYTSALENKFLKKFYTFFPPLFICFFLPSIFVNSGMVNIGDSKVYFVISRYLLPAALVLLTISIDFKEISKLGSKALIIFLTGTLGVVIGGPISLWVVMMIFPESIEFLPGDETWRGMTTIAGSWIGGGANQTAMKEAFQVGDGIFSAMVTVDVVLSNILLALLLAGAQRSERLDQWLKADASAVEEVKENVRKYLLSIQRIPSLKDFTLVLALGFGGVGISNFLADFLVPLIIENYPSAKDSSMGSHFFWVVVLATTLGMLLSTTRARKIEGAGASKIGGLFIYILAASIGLKMDVLAIFDSPVLMLIGFIWILMHFLFLIVVAKIIRAPFFFIAVGSQANIGGAASAPIVASAFHPALAPVGVLLAVLGYALGTYGATLCGLMMEWIQMG